nr:hypothetical protein Iba_chr04aCG8770 [Ipomoea batatas]
MKKVGVLSGDRAALACNHTATESLEQYGGRGRQRFSSKRWCLLGGIKKEGNSVSPSATAFCPTCCCWEWGKRIKVGFEESSRPTANMAEDNAAPANGPAREMSTKAFRLFLRRTLKKLETLTLEETDGGESSESLATPAPHLSSAASSEAVVVVVAVAVLEELSFSSLPSPLFLPPLPPSLDSVLQRVTRRRIQMEPQVYRAAEATACERCHRIAKEMKAPANGFSSLLLHFIASP